MTNAKKHEHCPLCDSSRTEIRHDRSRRFSYLKKDWILEGLEHTVCLDCGASFNAPGQTARNNERFLAFEKATTKGIAPREISALREKYLISQEEAARIFHTGKTAFSKWERGEVAPTGPTAVLLRTALDDDRLMRRLAADANVAISTTIKQPKSRTVVVIKPSAEVSNQRHLMDNILIMEMLRHDLTDQRFQSIADKLSVGTFTGMDPEKWRKYQTEHEPMWTIQ